MPSFEIAQTCLSCIAVSQSLNAILGRFLQTIMLVKNCVNPLVLDIAH